MSHVPLHQKVIEYISKNKIEKNKSEGKEQSNPNQDFQEQREKLPEDQKILIEKLKQKSGFLQEYEIYQILKKFDFTEKLAESHISVLLERSKEIDKGEWINVSNRAAKIRASKENIKPQDSKKNHSEKKKENKDEYNPESYGRGYYKKKQFRGKSYNNKRENYYGEEEEENYYYSPKQYFETNYNRYPKKNYNQIPYKNEPKYFYKPRNEDNAKFEVTYVPKEQVPKEKESPVVKIVKEEEKKIEKFQSPIKNYSPELKQRYNTKYDRYPRGDYKRNYNNNYYQKKRDLEITYVVKTEPTPVENTNNTTVTPDKKNTEKTSTTNSLNSKNLNIQSLQEKIAETLDIKKPDQRAHEEQVKEAVQLAGNNISQNIQNNSSNFNNNTPVYSQFPNKNNNIMSNPANLQQDMINNQVPQQTLNNNPNLQQNINNNPNLQPNVLNNFQQNMNKTQGNFINMPNPVSNSSGNPFNLPVLYLMTATGQQIPVLLTPMPMPQNTNNPSNLPENQFGYMGETPQISMNPQFPYILNVAPMPNTMPVNMMGSGNLEMNQTTKTESKDMNQPPNFYLSNPNNFFPFNNMYYNNK